MSDLSYPRSSSNDDRDLGDIWPPPDLAAEEFAMGKLRKVVQNELDLPEYLSQEKKEQLSRIIEYYEQQVPVELVITPELRTLVRLAVRNELTPDESALIHNLGGRSPALARIFVEEIRKLRREKQGG